MYKAPKNRSVWGRGCVCVCARACVHVFRSGDISRNGTCPGGEIPPLTLLSSCGWSNNKNDTRLSRGKETDLIGAHGSVIEIGPKKCPKQPAFIILDKGKINLRGIDRTEKLGFECFN